jgi:hypothetical protein
MVNTKAMRNKKEYGGYNAQTGVKNKQSHNEEHFPYLVNTFRVESWINRWVSL